MASRLYRVIVPVEEIERGAAFYAALLAMPGERVAPQRHYFDRGGTILACVQSFDHEAGRPIASDRFRPNPDHLYFAVPDLEAVLDRASSIEGQRWSRASALSRGASARSTSEIRSGIRSALPTRRRCSRPGTSSMHARVSGPSPTVEP